MVPDTPLPPRSMRVVEFEDDLFGLGSFGKQFQGIGSEVFDAPLDVGNPAGAHDVHGEHTQG